MSLLAIMCNLAAWSQHQVKYFPAKGETEIDSRGLSLETSFRTSFEASKYITGLPSLLQSKGFITASIDSSWSDSLQSGVVLFLGQKYIWDEVLVDSADLQVLQEAGWNPSLFQKKQVNLEMLQTTRDGLLDHFENNGYPFAKIEIDSIRIDGQYLSGRLNIERGPLYKIDSIRNMGNAKVSAEFLQRYLSFLPGSIFRKDKLMLISSRLQELPYVTETKPWDLTLLGTGSILNLYLDNRKSSQVNVLIGLLPGSQQLQDNKMQITGEANINLRNALGNGELIGLNWQQIQVKSPRLNLQYQHPYLFKSPVGVNFNFDLFKKDSSFVNINLLLGASYSVSATNTGSVFIQSWTSNLLTVDTMQVKYSRKLPQQADISSVQFGITYDLFSTDYRFNPRRGNDVNLVMSAGTKKVKVNHIIAELYDEQDPDFKFGSLYDSVKLKSYQFRMKIAAAHYFPLGKVSTLKAGLQAGWIESPNIFRNELFQLGGYKSLRGFDEESEYASGYSILTAEYRYLMGRNSFLFAFVDGGWTRNSSITSNPSYTYIGIGAGMAFETRAGIFNLSWAVGKRSDGDLNLRQSKIHLGYINYF